MMALISFLLLLFWPFLDAWALHVAQEWAHWAIWCHFGISEALTFLVFIGSVAQARKATAA